MLTGSAPPEFHAPAWLRASYVRTAAALGPFSGRAVGTCSANGPSALSSLGASAGSASGPLSGSPEERRRKQGAAAAVLLLGEGPQPAQRAVLGHAHGPG